MSPTSFFIIGLQLLFIGLRLANSITWSWWYVMLPLIIGLVIYIFDAVMQRVHEKKLEAAEKKLMQEEEERRRSGRGGKFMKRLQDAIDKNKADH